MHQISYKVGKNDGMAEKAVIFLSVPAGKFLFFPLKMDDWAEKRFSHAKKIACIRNKSLVH